jgi:5-methyltetrahydropteroyltriglutamate--homocysteine methyltransferase
MKIWNLGYPRIGKERQLKKLLESYWAGVVDANELETAAKKQMTERWTRQNELGVESIPLNDFSLYDHVLDTIFLLGLVPKRFQSLAMADPDICFAMARGTAGIAPLDMSKWFNTNYHYLVPEIEPDMVPSLHWDKLRRDLELSRSYPYTFHGVLVGPWTLSRLSKMKKNAGEFISQIIPLYKEILLAFKARGIEWVQMDEPSLGGDLLRDDLRTLKRIYDELGNVGPSLMLATYFESPEPWLSELAGLHVAGMHFDLVQGQRTLSWLRTQSFPRDRALSLGVVSGRNVWRADLAQLRRDLSGILEIHHPDLVFLAPSCSLLHLPIDKTLEKDIKPELLSWLSFADQRLSELFHLKKALQGNFGQRLSGHAYAQKRATDDVIEESEAALKKKAQSPLLHNAKVRAAVERIDEGMKRRRSPFAKRVKTQESILNLPFLPTTTIGSFPQTQELRNTRSQFKQGKMSEASYESAIQHEVEKVIRMQEKAGVDVLVHGEAERADMIEFFADGMEGMTNTSHGWVQSYGSRCTRPPLLFGDIQRKTPLTVKWFKAAQALTKNPVKGMLTGPVTLLSWSFVREDQPRSKTAYQLALAIRAEALDLEQAGAKVIQIDEPALREGLPMKKSAWNQYLSWAIDAFRVASSGVLDQTQIQTHMCYSEFADIMEGIIKLDADVLLVEYSRSGDSLLEAFSRSSYPADIGPGIYDIHSLQIPTVDELEGRVRRLLEVFPPERLWINPDCGLKTRTYSEIEIVLPRMVEAAKRIRGRFK